MASLDAQHMQVFRSGDTGICHSKDGCIAPALGGASLLQVHQQVFQGPSCFRQVRGVFQSDRHLQVGAVGPLPFCLVTAPVVGHLSLPTLMPAQCWHCAASGHQYKTILPSFIFFNILAVPALA